MDLKEDDPAALLHAVEKLIYEHSWSVSALTELYRTLAAALGDEMRQYDAPYDRAVDYRDRIGDTICARFDKLFNEDKPGVIDAFLRIARDPDPRIRILAASMYYVVIGKANEDVERVIWGELPFDSDPKVRKRFASVLADHIGDAPGEAGAYDFSLANFALAAVSERLNELASAD